MFSIRRAALPAALFCILAGCGAAAPVPSDVTQRIQSRAVSLERSGIAIRGERLLQRQAVARFYNARKSMPAWEGRDAERIVAAIRGISADGLEPGDYHLKAIESLLGREGRDPNLRGDLDVLLTDAVAGLIDHMRYGRVHPFQVNSAWNVDPRRGRPALERAIARIQSSRDVASAIAAERPDNFIYRGLAKELARLRKVVADGGWPKVRPGRTIRPGDVDRRIPSVRERLAASGEFHGVPGSDEQRYETRLVDAVKRFQEGHRLSPDGVIGPGTIEAMNVPAQKRADQVRVNLERARWVAMWQENQFMLVNIPAFKAYLIRGGRNVWEARTQVGEEGKETPTFGAMLTDVVFNPEWTVPKSIVREEITRDLRSGRNVIAQQGLRVYDSRGREVDPKSVNWHSDDIPFTLKQPPGNRNALGRVKFLFPNDYDIYLHDTPNKRLFDSNVRTFSHGCIRLENALDLARILLRGQGWNERRIQTALASKAVHDVQLEKPFPVLIVYWTVSVGAGGDVKYAGDVYGQDPRVLAALDSEPKRA
jgi:murein L,D-transpeptidase YcbB/YkuD